MQTQITTVYAEAFVEYAKEKLNNTNSLSLKDWGQTLKDCTILLSTNKKTWKLLLSPIIPAQEKIQILEKAFRGEETLFIIPFLSILAKRKRFIQLPEIEILVQKLISKSLNQQIVNVITAEPFSKAQKLKLNESLTQLFKKDIIFNIKIDKDLIGGFILRSNDFVLDASFSNRLKQIQKTLLTRSKTGEKYYEN